MHLQGSLVVGRFRSLPPLDQAKFFICCSNYMYLRNDRRDWKERPPFDRNHHRTFPEKNKKGNAPARQFGRRLISLPTTVGSSYVFEMLFLLHISTNWPPGLKGTHSIGQKSSSEMSWITKRKCTCRVVWSPADCSLFKRWIMISFGYVVSCVLHSEWWRSETHSPARFRACWTVARPFSGKLGFMQI